MPWFVPTRARGASVRILTDPTLAAGEVQNCVCTAGAFSPPLFPPPPPPLPEDARGVVTEGPAEPPLRAGAGAVAQVLRSAGSSVRGLQVGAGSEQLTAGESFGSSCCALPVFLIFPGLFFKQTCHFTICEMFFVFHAFSSPNLVFLRSFAAS